MLTRHFTTPSRPVVVSVVQPGTVDCAETGEGIDAMATKTTKNKVKKILRNESTFFIS